MLALDLTGLELTTLLISLSVIIISSGVCNLSALLSISPNDIKRRFIIVFVVSWVGIIDGFVVKFVFVMDDICAGLLKFCIFQLKSSICLNVYT